MKNIVCFGEVLWDVFPNHKKIGGAPLNVAVRLQSLKNNVSIISSIGQDSLGHEIIDFLKNHQINTNNVQVDPALETGKVNVTLDKNGSATYEIKSPVSWDNIQLTDEAKTLINAADALVFGSLVARSETSRNTLYELLKLPTYKIFDVNLRKPHYHIDALMHLMQAADFIKFNDDEIFEIVNAIGFPTENIEKAILTIANETDTKSICVTKGSKGAMLYYNGVFYDNKGYLVKVADTVGAGDSFLAALISTLLQNENPQKSIDYACAVGALVASKSGANPFISQSEVLFLMYV
jgi:fructokinase